MNCAIGRVASLLGAFAVVHCGGVTADHPGPSAEAGAAGSGAAAGTGGMSGVGAGGAGSAGASPTAGTGGAADHGAPASCVGMTPGAGNDCGASSVEDCCGAREVPGGSFFRFEDDVYSLGKAFPAEVSPFLLDTFEVTVGRFRAFVLAYTGPPLPGSGAHPLLAGSGWQATWPMAADATHLREGIRAESCPGATWTDTPAANERLPINCVSWAELFAFCAWDGGRLPTEAEHMFAEAGGSQQRVFPWSVPPTSVEIDTKIAWYSPEPALRKYAPLPVGSLIKGAGLFGHQDLGGNIAELVLDLYGGAKPPMVPCKDCARYLPSSPGARITRGGSFSEDANSVLVVGGSYLPEERHARAGGRCARR